MKNVQIPYELFFQLMKYHLMEDKSCEADIRRGMEKKLDALVMHELYKKSKSILNKKMLCNIFEVDLEKKDTCLCSYYLIRNMYYKNHYLKLLILTAIIKSVFLYGAVCLSNIFYIYFLPCVVLFLYECVSFLIISIDIQRLKI